METVFGWFPSSGLGTRCLKLLLHETWQAGACKEMVPKLEFGSQRKKIRVVGCAKARRASIGPMKA